MMGATAVDTTFAKWGCGIGMELARRAARQPTKSVYAGPSKCFNITLTGSSGGNVVRIGFTQSATPPSGAVAPFKEYPAFTNGMDGHVCFADVDVPGLGGRWGDGTCTKAGTDGTPDDMQIQVAAGSTTTTVGAFNVCISKVVPVSQRRHRHGRHGRRHQASE